MQGNTKGYFASLVGRSIAKPQGKAMQPPQSPHWAQQKGLEGDAFTESNLVEMTDWPDAFDGTPTQLPSQLSPSISMPQVLSPEGFTYSPPPSQPSPKVPEGAQLETPLVSPQTLQPEALQPEVGPLRKEVNSLPQEAQEILAMFAAQQPPAAEHAPTTLSPEPPLQETADPKRRSVPPKVLPQQRILREMHMEEGLIEDFKPRKPVVGATPAPVQPPVAPITPVQQQAPLAPAKPESLVPAAQQPPRLPQGPVVEHMAPKPLEPSRSGTRDQLQPQSLAPNPRPVPPPIAPAPKQGLVIGKLTIEVIEAPKPTVITHAAPVVSPKPGRQAVTSSRPRTNLQYGLGQL